VTDNPQTTPRDTAVIRKEITQAESAVRNSAANLSGQHVRLAKLYSELEHAMEKKYA
jgi:hypothetical protein